jgi:uncharacterized protein YbjT (DUF2867 family)
MKVLLFGATGMIGQGVLRECLLDPDVESVVTLGRTKTGQPHAKLREIEHKDLMDYTAIADQLTGFDACFFCLGVSSAGMDEASYTRITYDVTLAAAEALAKQSPGMTFVYVSGQSTDGTERGRTMWARVKGKTENALLRLPFKAAYMFRPGFIQPLHGIRSKTGVYRVMYTLIGPLIPLLKAAFPKAVLTTEQIGLAMLVVAKRGAPKKVLEPGDIAAL